MLGWCVHLGLARMLCFKIRTVSECEGTSPNKQVWAIFHMTAGPHLSADPGNIASRLLFSPLSQRKARQSR